MGMVELVCQSWPPKHLIPKVCEFEWKMCLGKVTCVGRISRTEVFPLLKTGAWATARQIKVVLVPFKERRDSSVFFWLGFIYWFLLNASCLAGD